MEKKIFDKFKELCKSSWAELAKTGNANKNEGVLGKFCHWCPACEIAKHFDLKPYVDCRMCPIDVWREKARSLPKFKPGMATCDSYGEPYDMWTRCSDVEQRKNYAKAIEELTWSFLPEYENKDIRLPIKTVEDITLDFILVNKDQEVTDLLEFLAIKSIAYPCLFVHHNGCDIIRVYGCRESVPIKDHFVDLLYQDE